MKTMMLSCMLLLVVFVLAEPSLYANDPDPERPELVFLESEWEALLQPQTDCPLPCWWGIEPGKTLYFQSGQGYLNYLGGLTQSDLSPWFADPPGTLYIYDSRYPNYPDRLMDIGRIPRQYLYLDYIWLNFTEINPQMRALAGYFRLDNLVAKHGLPDCVYPNASRWQDTQGQEQAVLYSLAICWQNLDMVVIYDLAEIRQPLGPSCLTMEESFGLEVYLLPARDFRTESFAGEAFLWAGPVQPVDEVLTVDQDTFIQMLVDGQNCLSIEQLLTIVK